MMELNSILNLLWEDYTDFNPSTLRIYNIFNSRGETVVNDHIAFRTLNDPRIDIDVIARRFTELGYVPKGDYIFEEKHLFAKHYENPGLENAPRIFISQLVLEDVSPFIRNTFMDLLDKLSSEQIDDEDLIFSGNIFNPLSFDVYNKLKEESEYAAWFYVFGFRANHFTVSVNALKKIDSLEKVNQLLLEEGFTLNTSGGAIKGSQQDLLRQSSTLADKVSIRFREGVYSIPCCYYEFAQRYPGTDGKLFSGFVAKSADKIFESTNNFLVK